MKITKRQLRRIIREEKANVVAEQKLRRIVRQQLIEQATYDQFSEDDVEELSYLLHDKGHTDLNNNDAIAKAFRLYGETTTMPLYRGVYKVEAQILQSKKIGDTFQLGRVTSFSENKNIAQGFASQGIMIEVVPGAEGCFNLMAFHVDFLNKVEAESPESFDMIDGDYQREESRREAEWLFPADAIYELLDTPEEGGFMVYKVKKV
jgi:hypothetical protein